jgi:hypothetical protein
VDLLREWITVTQPYPGRSTREPVRVQRRRGRPPEAAKDKNAANPDDPKDAGGSDADKTDAVAPED